MSLPVTSMIRRKEPRHESLHDHKEARVVYEIMSSLSKGNKREKMFSSCVKVAKYLLQMHVTDNVINEIDYEIPVLQQISSMSTNEFCQDSRITVVRFGLHYEDQNCEAGLIEGLLQSITHVNRTCWEDRKKLTLQYLECLTGECRSLQDGWISDLETSAQSASNKIVCL